MPSERRRPLGELLTRPARLDEILRRLVDCVRAKDYDVGFVRALLPAVWELG